MFYQAERRYKVKETVKSKYEFLHPIGEGSSSKVYLVRHKELSRLFIYKESKPGEEARIQHHHEVLVLRNLSFPGMPTLYEFKESSDESIIVEDYISGKSLHTILMQFISQEQFISYAIQMIRIIRRFHEYPEGAILYLDFKQEHFIIQEETVYLVDFGLAMFESDGCKEKIQFGTRQYSAPETLMSQTATTQSDIYSLGVLLREMWEKTRFENATIESKTRKIIEQMTNDKAENRTKTLAEPYEVFTTMHEQQTSKDKTVLNYKIAVIGSQPRVGTTFVATLVTSCLNRLHYPACYRENPQNRWIQESSLTREGSWQGKIGRREKFRFLPDLGPFVVREAEKKSEKCKIQVYDMGCYHEKCALEDFQLVILVVGARPWEQHQSKACFFGMREMKNPILVSTLATRREIQELSKQLKNEVYRIPLLENPFMPGRKLCKFVLQTGKNRNVIREN